MRVDAGPPIHAGIGRLRLEASINRIDGPPEYALGDVQDITARSDASVFIIDRSGPVVRQYDRSGRYVRDIGRRGEGPGEYQSATTVAILPGNRLAVRDPRARRLHIYDSAGVWKESWFVNTTHSSAVGSMIPIVDGTVVLASLVIPLGWQQTPQQDRPPDARIRIRADGSLLDTIYDPVLPQRAPIVTNREGHRSFRLPFAPATVPVAVSPLGYFVTGASEGRNGAYTFELRTALPAGGTAVAGANTRGWSAIAAVTSVRSGYQPAVVHAAERDDHRLSIERAIHVWDAAWRWNSPDIPRVKAPYKSLWVDEEGRTWVHLSTEAREEPSVEKRSAGDFAWARWQEPSLYDVFEPTGRYLGRIQGPGTAAILRSARGDQVWVMEAGEDGITLVRRYTMVWAAR
jgi:hypothetical protein